MRWLPINEEVKMSVKKKILVVEDDPIALKTLGRILEESSYKVICASNGEEAVRKANQEELDVVLLDTRLPKMDGYAVCREIKKTRGLSTKVIVYTGFIDVVNAEKAREAGADDYVVKTDDFEDILKVLTVNTVSA
jgi:DNA-binding response OmpR family regulator